MHGYHIDIIRRRSLRRCNRGFPPKAVIRTQRVSISENQTLGHETMVMLRNGLLTGDPGLVGQSVSLASEFI